jgi:hypothetical protein
MVEVQSCESDALPAPFSLAQRGLGFFSIVEFPWLATYPFLADVTMGTKSCTLLRGKNVIKAVM